jgi:hypothetical protein
VITGPEGYAGWKVEGGRRCRVRKNGGELRGRPKPTPGCNAEEEEECPITQLLFKTLLPCNVYVMRRK